MKKLTDLEYLRLSKGGKALYKIKLFLSSIFPAIGNGIKRLGRSVGGFFQKIWNGLRDIGRTFKDGSWQTKLSYFVMGFGNYIPDFMLKFSVNHCTGIIRAIPIINCSPINQNRLFQ